jgi:hypothetical protein
MECRNVISSSEDLQRVLARYQRKYLIIGFSSAQFDNLERIVSCLKTVLSDQLSTLLIYGGDKAIGERTLGDLVAELKRSFGVGTLAFICDRSVDEAEAFIDIVHLVAPSFDSTGGIIYGGVLKLGSSETSSSIDQSNKEFQLLGNTQFYLNPDMCNQLTGVLICGGGAISLQEFKYVVENTSLPYAFIECALPRYPELYGYTAGPVHEWVATAEVTRSREINL